MSRMETPTVKTGAGCVSMYDPDYTRKFYDAYGSFEWDRLDVTAHGSLQAIIHADFIGRYIRQGDRVLDAGCGPGRFTTTVAKLGAAVTALDLSERQLELAEEKISEAGLLEAVDAFVPADITDLSLFPDGQFDAVICYGGALSYVCERRHRAASELVRVVRPGGILLVSVMSRYGAMANLVRHPTMTVLKDPEGWHVWRVAEDGDLPGFPSTHVDMQHPAMHMFTSDELRRLLPGCRVLEMAGSNVTTFEGSTTIDEVLGDQQAWTTAVELERELNSRPGLVDNGSHIIMAAQRAEA